MADFYAYIMNADFFSDASVFDDCLNSVSEYRRNKVNRLARIDDKRMSLAAGVLLAYALDKKFGIKENNMNYICSKGGKPYLEGRSDVFFSISHTSGFVAVIVGDAPCGIDIECVRKFPASIVNRLFSAKDRDIYNSDDLSEEEKDRYAVSVWTRREAYVKFTGTGILMNDDAQKHVMEKNYMKSMGCDVSNWYGELKLCDNNEYGDFDFKTAGKSIAAVCVPSNTSVTVGYMSSKDIFCFTK